MKMIETLLSLFFRLHDWATDWFAKHLSFVKISILLVAHISLFGFFFPDLRKPFGELAGNLLIGILFLSPLSRIFRMRALLQLMSIRRELGILMGYLATVHAVGYLVDPDWFELAILPGYQVLQNGYLFGILAYVLTLPLLLTSNNFAQKNLGSPTWKTVHRIIYVMFVFAVLHRFFIKTGSDGTVTIAFVETTILLGSYAFLKLLAWRNFLPPLRGIIGWISTCYRLYKTQQTEAKTVL